MSPVLKKKPEKQKMPGKYVLLIYTFISLALMAVTFSGLIPDSFIRNTLGFAVIPFQKGIVSVTTVLTDVATKNATIAELYAENEALKEQIDQLEEENNLLLQDKYELQELRNLYELDQTYSDYQKIGAAVISWDTSNWFNSFVVNKGSNDGVKVDMNVISGSGLVGRITEVGPNWSRVTSIIEDNSNVSAYVLHTGDNLIVSGDMKLIDKGYISFSQLIDSTGSVEKGDKVVTSFISDKYLPGILIGYISTIEHDSNQITKSGQLSPVVDFSHITKVLIITELKESYEF